MCDCTLSGSVGSASRPTVLSSLIGLGDDECGGMRRIESGSQFLFSPLSIRTSSKLIQLNDPHHIPRRLSGERHYYHLS